MDDAHLVQDAVHRRFAHFAVIATAGGVAICGDEAEACFGPSGYGAGGVGSAAPACRNASLGMRQSDRRGRACGW